MATTQRRGRWTEGPLRALKHYNFRVFWLGQLLSLIGSWMQGLAQGWLILVLADPTAAAHVMHTGGDATSTVSQASAAVQATANHYSGLVNFWSGIPILLITLFAGVVVDKVNKRRLLVVTQIGMMCTAAFLGILIRTGAIQISYVMLAAFAVGLLMAFDMPARQSFVVEMVGKADLPSAVALNSSMFNAARSVGPAVAGLLLAAHVSLASCFLLNAASYIVVLIGIGLMRGKGLGDPVPLADHETELKLLDNLKAGLVYVWNNHTTRNVIFLIGALGTFSFSFNILIPTFVRYSLMAHATNAEQVKAFGFLETFRGVGALIAAVVVGLYSRADRYKFMIVGGSILSNALLMLFAWERRIEYAYITMAIVTFGFILIFASANTVMQMTVPDNLRGRVMSIYTLVFIGTGPIGALLAGQMAQYTGAPWTIFAFALITFILVIVISFRPGGLMTITVSDGMNRMPAVVAPKPSATT